MLPTFGAFKRSLIKFISAVGTVSFLSVDFVDDFCFAEFIFVSECARWGAVENIESMAPRCVRSSLEREKDQLHEMFNCFRYILIQFIAF